MNKTHLAWGAAALALVGIAGTAVAQQAAHHMGKGGAMASATVTRAEAQTRAAAKFDRMDANKDGKLDAADRTARMDQHFDAMDTNKDGKIDRAEFMAGHARMGEDHGHMGQGGPGHHMRGHGKMGGHMMGGRMMAGMDANGDKAISRDEFIAGALKRFDTADANHDGKVTPEERRAAKRAHMGEMHRTHGHQGKGQPTAPAPAHTGQ